MTNQPDVKPIVQPSKEERERTKDILGGDQAVEQVPAGDNTETTDVDREDPVSPADVRTSGIVRESTQGKRETPPDGHGNERPDVLPS